MFVRSNREKKVKKETCPCLATAAVGCQDSSQWFVLMTYRLVTVIIAFSFCSANSKSDKDGIVHFNALNFINLKFETWVAVPAQHKYFRNSWHFQLWKSWLVFRILMPSAKFQAKKLKPMVLVWCFCNSTLYLVLLFIMLFPLKFHRQHRNFSRTPVGKAADWI